MNMLPMVRSESLAGRHTTVMVSEQYQGLLNGVSYADRFVYRGEYNQLPDALKLAERQFGQKNIVCCQWHRHPKDQLKLTDSYAKEAWRLAGRLSEFRTAPLVFDCRKLSFEEQFYSRFPNGKPWILLAVDGRSSPFPKGIELFQQLTATFPECHVINIGNKLAHDIYDVLGALDRASVLVTIDSALLHLSRASRCPVISLINDGWKGSIPPEQSVITFRYSDLSTSLAPVVSAVQTVLRLRTTRPPIIHAVNTYGDTPRHRRAQQSWKSLGLIPCYWKEFIRSSAHIGCPRKLPFLKDLLQAALGMAGDDQAIILWTNDDNVLSPKLPEIIQRHVMLYGAVSMRRYCFTDQPFIDNPQPTHVGRELFAFRAGWLKLRMNDIPDYILGAEQWDLGMAAFIRAQCHLKTTMHNLVEDFFPCELPKGLVWHERHESAWLSPNSPSNLHNKKLAAQWIADIPK